jgi:hypothetical protein
VCLLDDATDLEFLGPDLTIVLNANLRGGQEAQRDADSNLLQRGASRRTSSVCMLTVVAIVIALPPETESHNKAEETVPDLRKMVPRSRERGTIPGTSTSLIPSHTPSSLATSPPSSASPETVTMGGSLSLEEAKKILY